MTVPKRGLSRTWVVLVLPFLCLLVLCPKAVRAGDGPPCRIEVEGNDRTNEKVILRAADILDWSGPGFPSPEKVARKVRNTKLFSDVDVVLFPQDTPPTLYIRVEDRWTLTPVPFIESFEGDTKVGLNVVEYNLLGMGKTLLFGGAIATKGFNLYTSFKDPAIGYSRANGALSATYRRYAYREFDGSDVVQSFTDEFWFVDVELGYELSEDLSFGFKFSLRRDRIVREDTALPLEDGWGNMLSAWARFDASDYRYFFSEGLQVRVETSLVHPGLGSNTEVYKIEGAATYTLALPGDHALTFFFQAGLMDGRDARFVFKIGSTTGSRSLPPQGLWARQYGVAGVEYQVPFWRMVVKHGKPLGTCALVGFGEVGSAQRVPGDRASFSAVGLGFRFYLRDVTIPTISIHVLYDPVENRFLPGLGVGTNW